MSRTKSEIQKDLRDRKRANGEVVFERRVSIAERDELDAYLKKLLKLNRKDQTPIDCENQNNIIRYSRHVTPENRDRMDKYLRKMRGKL